MRTRETDIEVFRGEIESLAVAGVQGVGIRVITDHRQGFAWAGTFDADVIAETLAEARDNATFAEPDEWSGLASPADVASAPVPDLDLWREELLGGHDRREGAVHDRARRARRAAPTRGSARSSRRATATVSSRPRSRARRESRPRCGARCARRGSVALAEADGQTQTGYGFSVGRTFADLDADQSSRWRPSAALRLLGARQPKGRRLAVVLDPLVTAQFLGVLSAAFNGESMLKGRSLFLDRVGEAVAAPIVAARRRPDRSVDAGRDHARRRGRAVPAQPARRRRRAAGFPAQQRDRAARGYRDDGFGDPRRLHVDAGRRRARVAARARDARARRDHRVASRRALRAVGERAALGHQPDQRRLLRRRRRPRGSRRCARGAGARSDDRVDACRACCSTSPRSAPTSPRSAAAPPASRSSSPR